MKIKIALLGMMALLLYISASLTLTILFLGFMLILPVAVVTYVFIQGIPLLKREMNDLLTSGRDFFLITISREYVILEPQFR